MPDSTAIAIVSVSVAGLSTIAAPLVTGWLESRREARRFKQDRIVKDFDELRDLLDQAADAFSRFLYETRGIHTAFTFTRSTEHSAYRSKMEAVVETRTAAYELGRRLVIRLGRKHAIVDAYGDGLTILNALGTEAVRLITERTLNGTELDDEELLAFEKRANADEQRAADVHERFLDAATALVGSPIEPLR